MRLLLIVASLVCFGIGFAKDCHCNSLKPGACHCTTAFVEVNRVKTITQASEDYSLIEKGKSPTAMVQMKGQAPRKLRH